MDLLLKWQKSINLISANTIYEAWPRHFEDSLQLVDYIPSAFSIEEPDLFTVPYFDKPAAPDIFSDEKEQKTVLFDLGSGAGFPGLVLAIALPDLEVTLIESDRKKCTFLSTVSRETSTKVKIMDQRIELASLETIPAIVTARALAPLDKLLEYCVHWAGRNPGLMMLFHKGENAEKEIEEARAHFNFDVEIFPSKTDKTGKILKILNLSGKSAP